MRNKENYSRNVLLYYVLDKGEFFSLNTTFKKKIQPFEIFESGMSLIEHFEKKLDSEWVCNNCYKNQPYLYLLLKDSLLWAFLENLDNGEKTSETIEKYFSKTLKSIKVTNRGFMDSLLVNEFSDNLLELTIVQDEYIDFIEPIKIYGSQINYSLEYEQVINENTKIISFSLQPKGETNVITFWDENYIEFSKHMKLSEIIRVINKLTDHYERFIRRDGVK